MLGLGSGFLRVHGLLRGRKQAVADLRSSTSLYVSSEYVCSRARRCSNLAIATADPRTNS